MTVKLLTAHHLEFQSLKGGCSGLSESTLVKMPHCWKSRVTAHMCFFSLAHHSIPHFYFVNILDLIVVSNCKLSVVKPLQLLKYDDTS